MYVEQILNFLRIFNLWLILWIKKINIQIFFNSFKFKSKIHVLNLVETLLEVENLHYKLMQFRCLIFIASLSCKVCKTDPHTFNKVSRKNESIDKWQRK